MGVPLAKAAATSSCPRCLTAASPDCAQATPKGEAVKDYSVVVFPADREKWTPNSRYVKTARPDQDGRYKVTGLPPGEYRVIALDYVDSNEWNDPDFLERVRSKTSAFSINEGETKSVDLRITPASS